MAIYSTFLMCRADELPGRFPDWLAPLPQPVRREVWNPFTNQMSIIETRQPEWPDDVVEQQAPAYTAIPIKGNYSDYLEGRLAPPIRSLPHWCSKGLTEIEFDALGETMGLGTLLESALYSHPSSGAVLLKFRPEFVARLRGASGQEVEGIAAKWAQAMSQPEHTLSASGRRINDGWTTADATGLLKPIVALPLRGEPTSSMYLLIEA